VAVGLPELVSGSVGAEHHAMAWVRGRLLAAAEVAGRAGLSDRGRGGGCSDPRQFSKPIA
jgi:hypothetical protein